MNAWLYSEQEVLDMIEEKYPGAERIERPVRSRPQVLTRKTYLKSSIYNFLNISYTMYDKLHEMLEKITLDKKQKMGTQICSDFQNIEDVCGA